MGNLFSAALIFCALYYFGFLFWCIRGWGKLKTIHQFAETFQTNVTVVVPARNEEANITACLDALIGQQFPPELFEILIVDDHSTDATVSLVKAFQKKAINHEVTLLNNDAA